MATSNELRGGYTALQTSGGLHLVLICEPRRRWWALSPPNIFYNCIIMSFNFLFEPTGVLGLAVPALWFLYAAPKLEALLGSLKPSARGKD